MRGSKPQAALSGVGLATERHAFIKRPWLQTTTSEVRSTTAMGTTALSIALVRFSSRSFERCRVYCWRRNCHSQSRQHGNQEIFEFDLLRTQFSAPHAFAMHFLQWFRLVCMSMCRHLICSRFQVRQNLYYWRVMFAMEGTKRCQERMALS